MTVFLAHAKTEKERIEDKYDIDLDDTSFDLKYSQAKTDKHNAYILEKGDEKMVALGYFTSCCQRLNEAGETAMIHGLVNPNAGFWVIEDEHGKIIAQAEVWEKDKDTLVFDSIEFASGLNIENVQEVLSKWVKDSKYDNIILGLGHDGTKNILNLPFTTPLVPTLTPFELFILDQQDEAKFESVADAEKYIETYGTDDLTGFVYSDADSFCVSLKQVDKTLIPETGTYIRQTEEVEL